MTQPVPTSAAPIHRPFRPTAIFLGMPALFFLLAGFLSPHGYARGLNNDDKPFFMISVILVAVGIGLLVAALFWTLFAWKRTSKATHRVALVCLILPPLLSILILLLQIHPYERGLTAWARKRVDAKAVRAWYAALKSAPLATEPAATATTYVSPNGYPMFHPYISPLPGGAEEHDSATYTSATEIALLGTQRVWSLPTEPGVFLEWGTYEHTFAFTSTRRFVFISTDLKSGPPDINEFPKHLWRRAAPGVWVMAE